MSTAQPRVASVAPIAGKITGTADPAFGRILRDARKRQQLTLRDVAHHLNITHTAVAHWEKGIQKPSLTKRVQLAKLFQLELAALVPEASDRLVVTDPHLVALLKLLDRVPHRQRDTLLDIVSVAAAGLATRTD